MTAREFPSLGWPLIVHWIVPSPFTRPRVLAACGETMACTEPGATAGVTCRRCLRYLGDDDELVDLADYHRALDYVRALEEDQ